MTSKERILAALACRDVDRVPVPQRFWSGYPREEAFKWSSIEEEVRWKKECGFDPFIWIPSPVSIDHSHQLAPDIEQRHRVVKDPDENYPILCSEWKNKEGSLTAKIRMTNDYPFREMELFSDYNTSRYVKPLLANGADMLTLVRMDPFRIGSGQAREVFRQKCHALRRLADAEQIPVCCHGGASLDYLIQGCTAEGAVLLAVDYPEETMALLEYLNVRTDRHIEAIIH